ncbi:hypothetical protein [Mycobacterium adipatum]|uniref:hypothetical protein n=1 Tax=Mycobacterium adipatum TaxID=1682113 RepID=UPI0034E0A0A6
MAWEPPQKPGDQSASVAEAKDRLRKYSYGKAVGDGPLYTVEFGVALVGFQTRRNLQILRGQVKDMPGMNTVGKLDWATKKNLGLLAPPAVRNLPVVFTINGHMGGLFDGPAYFTARVLEEQGRVRVQPVGYNNTRKPFDNASGTREMLRLVNDPAILPVGTPWAIDSHSQGSVVECDFYEQHIQPNQNVWPYSHYRGGVRFGNPRRPMNTVAAWIADPPPQGSEGLDPNCLKEPTPGVAECSRDGDLYANKTPGLAADYKEAVYMAVCRGKFTGRDSLATELGELATRFGNPIEIFALFQAIVSGVSGLIQLREHGEFDLRPCIDHTARILGV